MTTIPLAPVLVVAAFALLAIVIQHLFLRDTGKTIESLRKLESEAYWKAKRAEDEAERLAREYTRLSKQFSEWKRQSVEWAKGEVQYKLDTYREEVKRLRDRLGNLDRRNTVQAGNIGHYQTRNFNLLRENQLLRFQLDSASEELRSMAMKLKGH